MLRNLHGANKTTIIKKKINVIYLVVLKITLKQVAYMSTKKNYYNLNICICNEWSVTHNCSSSNAFALQLTFWNLQSLFLIPCS